MTTENTQTHPRLPKRSHIVIISVCVILFIAILVVSIVCLLASRTDIPDTNGSEDTSLSTITLEQILQSKDEYSSFGISEFHDGDRTNVEGAFEKRDYDSYRLRCQKMSGIMTVLATNTNSDCVKIHIDATLTAGNLEIIIMIDGTYHSHVPIGEPQSVLLNDVAGKEILVRIAAESAAFDLRASREL